MQIHQGARLNRRLLITTVFLPANVVFRIGVEKFRVENFFVDFFLQSTVSCSDLNGDAIKVWRRTCSSFLSFSLRFEFRSSCVIFCCNFSISSAFACSSGVMVVTVVLSADVSFPSSSVLVGTVTNPRAPRFRSFSRMSIKFCENLAVNGNFLWLIYETHSNWTFLFCISWINWIRIPFPCSAVPPEPNREGKVTEKSGTNWS